MACFDRFEFGTDEIIVLANDYPGCGMCSHCCRTMEKDERDEAYAIAKEWEKVNAKRYRVIWETESSNGDFEFNCSSLEKAREVAQNSVYAYTSLLVTQL